MSVLKAFLCPHCGGPLTLPAHSPDGAPAASDLRDILAGIQRIETLMSETNTAEAALAASVAKLQTDLSGLLQGLPAQIQAALAAAGIDDDANAKAIAGVQSTIDAMDAQVQGALAPAPAPAEA